MVSLKEFADILNSVACLEWDRGLTGLGTVGTNTFRLLYLPRLTRKKAVDNIH